MPVIKGIVKSLTEQSTPAGSGGLDSESQKAQSAFSQDRSCNAESETDKDRPCNIGQQMAEHDLVRRKICNFTTHNIRECPLFQGFSPHQHGKSDPAGQPDDTDDHENGLFKLSVSQCRHQYQKQKEGGETHKHLHQTHNDQIHCIPVISGGDSHGGPDDDGKKGGDDAHCQRCPGAVDHPG